MRAAALAAYSAVLLSAAHKLKQAGAGAAQHDLAKLIIRLRARLNRPPRCVLLGEINSGKSSLANLLIGENVVPTSVVANSRFPIRFHHAGNSSLAVLLRDGTRKSLDWSQSGMLPDLPLERIDIGLPVERLKVFEVIDMPGGSNPARDISGFERQVALGNILIWCTVAARAWKESERKQWSRLRAERKDQSFLVVTQIDLLPDRGDLQKVLERLDGETAGQFRTIAPLAIPDAVMSSAIGPASANSNLWASSGGRRFEADLERSLSELSDQRVLLAQRALRLAFMRRGLLADEAGDTLQLGKDTWDDLMSGDLAESDSKSASAPHSWNHERKIGGTTLDGVPSSAN